MSWLCEDCGKEMRTWDFVPLETGMSGENRCAVQEEFVVTETIGDDGEFTLRHAVFCDGVCSWHPHPGSHPWLDAEPTEAGPYWVRADGDKPFVASFDGVMWFSLDAQQYFDFAMEFTYQFQRIEPPR